MAEQLPTNKMTIGGQEEVEDWIVRESVWGKEEDDEDVPEASGKFRTNITYSRRQTLRLTLEATGDATADEFRGIGEYEHDDVLYKVRDVQETRTRGPVQVTLDLISTVDDLAPA